MLVTFQLLTEVVLANYIKLCILYEKNFIIIAKGVIKWKHYKR